MNFLSEIDKIKEESFSAAVLNTILLIAPGLTFILHFSKELLITLDVLKLILLSISFIAPLLIINFILVTIISDKMAFPDIKHDKGAVFIIITLALLFSASILYIALFFGYILNLSFRITIIFVLCLQFIWTIVLLSKPVKPISSSTT